ncbi:MAG: GNAT family N-acetyltransferase [Acidimicrobiia bacterium]|nr:GNAT family N-acetyltransferase [Acidimicrobiia bacterium]
MDDLDLASRLGPPPDSLNTFRLETPRLVMARTEEADALSMFNLLSGPDRDAIVATLRWDGPDSYEEFAAFTLAAADAQYASGGFHWSIRDRTGELSGTEGQAIGHIGTRPLMPGRGDVGYWLGRPYWGWGLMTEALSAVRDLAFEQLNLAKLEAEVFADNAAGNRLVERVGMIGEGVVRRYMFKQDRWIDANRYGMLYEEWLAAR